MTIRKVLFGLLAGLLSGPVGLLVVYLIGVVVTAIKTHGVIETLLVAGSVLPLMLILVLLVPTLMISVLSGLIVAVLSNFTRRLLLIGLGLGVLLSEVIVTLVLPLVIVPKPGDFTSIIVNPVLSGSYGLLLGGITATFFSLMNRQN